MDYRDLINSLDDDWPNIAESQAELDIDFAIAEFLAFIDRLGPSAFPARTATCDAKQPATVYAGAGAVCKGETASGRYPPGMTDVL